jgi:hypothetical protein
MKLAEEYKVLCVASALNWTTGASQDTDSINMKNFHSCTYLIDVGTMAAGNSTMTIASGPADGVKTTALTFKYAYGGATAIYSAPGVGHDVLAASTSVATLEIDQGTYPNYLLVVEVDASQMDVANGHEWLTMTMTDIAATGLTSIMAVLKPRFTEANSATCLT